MDDLSLVEKGYANIPEPIADEPVADDETALVLMPGLAFDPQGDRELGIRILSDTMFFGYGLPDSEADVDKADEEATDEASKDEADEEAADDEAADEAGKDEADEEVSDDKVEKDKTEK